MRIADLALTAVVYPQAYPQAWAQSDLFAAKVYPALEAAGCRNCHSTDGVASPTRLRFPIADAPPARIAAFGRSLAILVDRANPDKSALVLKPTKRIAHSGGERIKQGSEGEQLLRQWAAIAAKFSDAEVTAALAVRDIAVATATPKLRRLTHTQYNNTVRDLLGDASLPANQFPPEDFVNGFRNQTQAQSVSPLLAEAYSAAAEKLARTAFRGGDTNKLIGCNPSAECRAQFIASFGRKAFRRPLSAAEVRRYDKVFASEKNFIAGAQLVVEAMLQAPGFLFRRDTGDGYAAASRLSYFLWDSMPDPALFDEAASGRLNSPEGIERAAARLLDDAKARQALDEFASQWLRFDRVITSVKDRRVFANFNRETAISMTEETRRFIADLVWNDRDFTQLFTADYGFLNDDLASIYKAPKPSEEFGRVVFPASAERAGILGQATFLSLTSKPDDTSPTARGLFIREQFLCQHVPEPPPGVAATLPPVAESKPMANRERLGVHLSNPSCASCHSLVDPIGFGFEKFDAVGGRREKLKIAFAPGRKDTKKETTYAEVDLDTKGWVAGVPNSDFSNPRELGAILARTPQCHECVVKQLFRWAAGRPETPADEEVLKRALADFRGSQFRFKQLMISLAKWMDNGERNHKTD